MFLSERDKQTVFQEIEVERINVVERDGNLKMVISNAHRQHSGMLDGKEFEPRERPAGIIFFNSEQDEVGGVIYDGTKDDGVGMVISFDQYKNDQIMQLQYQEGDNKRSYGLHLWDRDDTFSPHKLNEVISQLKAKKLSGRQVQDELRRMNNGEPISASRLFVGKKTNKEVGVFVRDHEGRERIRIYVDENDEPRIDFLNEKQKIVAQFPQSLSSDAAN